MSSLSFERHQGRETQAAELESLKEIVAILEVYSGANILKEVEERKSREANLVFYPKMGVRFTMPNSMAANQG